MGLGEVVESALQAHDGDGDVGQAGEVARQVSGVHPAPVLVVGDVTHVVDSVLYAPVPSDQGKDSFGAGVLEGQRGQSMDGLVLHDAGLSVPSLALDAERDPAMGELGLAGVGIGAQVDDPARAFLQPPVSFVLGPARCSVARTWGRSQSKPARSASSASRLDFTAVMT